MKGHPEVWPWVLSVLYIRRRMKREALKRKKYCSPRHGLGKPHRKKKRGLEEMVRLGGVKTRTDPQYLMGRMRKIPATKSEYQDGVLSLRQKLVLSNTLFIIIGKNPFPAASKKQRGGSGHLRCWLKNCEKRQRGIEKGHGVLVHRQKPFRGTTLTQDPQYKSRTALSASIGSKVFVRRISCHAKLETT